MREGLISRAFFSLTTSAAVQDDALYRIILSGQATMDLTTSTVPTLVEPSKWTFRNGSVVSDRYEILNEVGKGGMGVVFRARHRQLDKEVAIKVMLPGAPVERFLREAKVLARIASPYVVTVHDFDVLAGECPILVMQWIEGQDLGQLFRHQPETLTEETIVPWMRQVAEGMKDAAELGIIHRDLKPSNILIDRSGKAIVVDFGLARGVVELSEQSLIGGLMGTPHYMAPEQAENPRSVDTRADIYSFGATFYHLLTGHVPFQGESAFSILFKHKTEPLIAPQARNPALSERINALLERCLAKSPVDRFCNFESILEQLRPTTSIPGAWDRTDDPALEKYLTQYQQRRTEYLEESKVNSEPEDYFFPGNRRLRIVVGDITKQEVDAIVSSDDEYLSMGGGVSQAIQKGAGIAFIHTQTRPFVPVRPGRVVVTPAGRLPARFIFHGVTLAFGNEGVLWPSRDLILEILNACVFQADSLYVERIAFPLLGTGVGGFSRDVCLDTLFHFLSRLLLRGLTTIRDARIVIYR